MFVKSIFVFSVILLFNEFVLQATNGEPEKMVQLPQSLIDELLKKKDDVDGVKELLSLLSSSNTTQLVKNPESQPCPIRKLATGIRQLIRNLRSRIKTAKSMILDDTCSRPYRSKKVTKFMFVLEGLLKDLQETIKIGRELKPVWDSIKTFLKEDDYNY